MAQNNFLGTIGWIKSNLMISSQASEKGYNNENFIPGAENIPDSEPTRPDGIPPVTDGLVYCFDGNLNGDYDQTGTWGVSWKNLVDGNPSWVSTTGFTNKSNPGNQGVKWWSDNYGKYVVLDYEQQRGIRCNINLPNAEHTFIMLVRKALDTDFIVPVGMINERNIYSQFYPPRPDTTYGEGSDAGYYNVSLRGDNQGGNYQSAKFTVDKEVPVDKPILIAGIVNNLGDNTFQTSAWFNNSCTKSSTMKVSTAGKFSGDIKFGGKQTSNVAYQCERYIYACYFYNRALTDVEYAKVKDYISKRYNLSL